MSLSLSLIGLFFARTFYRLKIITVADFMLMRFGHVASVAIMIVTLLVGIYVSWLTANPYNNQSPPPVSVDDTDLL